MFIASIWSRDTRQAKCLGRSNISNYIDKEHTFRSVGSFPGTLHR